jgi:hypothetical protein
MLGITNQGLIIISWSHKYKNVSCKWTL